MNKKLLQNIPPVHELLETPEGQSLCDSFGRSTVKEQINQYLDELRSRILDNGSADDLSRDLLNPSRILQTVEEHLESSRTPSIRRVINGTGVVLHTGLGRAVFSEDVLEHIQDVNRGYSLLAMDAENKERVRREHRAADMICELTGAEAATAVNNNAAAVFLTLAAFARDREVVISRGELVEIGGSFRIPDVMEQSGAELVEVGTTNKTHPSDYEQAITDDTALLLKAHTSNYRIVGFQDEVEIDELSDIAHAHDLMAVEDLGSGALFDVSRMGMGHEPVARERIDGGADLVMFSGDKLLGGPQAGLIAGRKEHIDTLRNHPLFRAMRLDKLILSALEKTLATYLSSDDWAEDLPVYEMLSRPKRELKQEAESLKERVDEMPGMDADVIEGTSRVGGGSLPGEKLPTYLVRITPSGMSANELSLSLRRQDPPVFGRVMDNSYHIDPRTLVDGDEDLLVDLLSELAHHS
jgi:L-seryl-tRNA(Ser) seleniumtransferase